MRLAVVTLASVLLALSLAGSGTAMAEDAVPATTEKLAATEAAPVVVEEPAMVEKPKPKAVRRCQRLAHSVNDYGKDGPTADAKKGLDAYAARWAAEHKIKKYQLGKKTVTCKLFLDFGFFDEYTCEAQANLCY